MSRLNITFAFSDWFNLILVFAAFAGISLALFGSGAERIPVSMSVVTTVLGGLGTIILLIYLISPPGAPGAFGTEEFDIAVEWGDPDLLPEHTDGGAIERNRVSLTYLSRLQAEHRDDVRKAESALDRLLGSR